MAGLLSGCLVTPEPIEPATFDTLISADRKELFGEQEPVSIDKPITLEEAIARALKYNLDHRVAAMEQALALGQSDVSQYDLLPAVVAKAGYTGRDNQKASSSRNIDTLQQSLTTSTSEDRSLKNFDLTFTWNILDFGVSYYQARQDADRVLIAEENRRRVFQNLVADIRNAYWRAASAQRMKVEVDKILEKVKGPIAKSRKVVEESLLPPLPVLREHKNLINIVRQLEALRLEAELATAKLAFLMGLERGTRFRLVELDEQRLPLPKLIIANVPWDEGKSISSSEAAKMLDALESLALRGRSELREQIYNERIDAAETKKAMLRLLPGLEFSAGQNFDSNSFLANQSWGTLGVKVTFNLFNLLKGRSAIDVAETKEKVTHLRRLALNMAVLTQVNLAFRDYLAARKRLERAEEVNTLDGKILKILQAQYDAKQKGVNENDAVKAATEAVKTRLQRLQAYSDVQNTLGRIYVSIGVDMKPKVIKSASVADLTEALRNRFDQIRAGSLGIETTASAPSKTPMIKVGEQNAVTDPAPQLARRVSLDSDIQPAAGAAMANDNGAVVRTGFEKKPVEPVAPRRTEPDLQARRVTMSVELE